NPASGKTDGKTHDDTDECDDQQPPPRKTRFCHLENLSKNFESHCNGERRKVQINRVSSARVREGGRNSKRSCYITLLHQPGEAVKILASNQNGTKSS